MNQLALLDWGVVALYFIVIYVVAIKFGSRARQGSSEYFLAGRNVGWFVIGASIFASNIGSEHLVGLAGSGAAGAFPAAQFELIAAFALLLLGWLFVPFYVRSGVFTMPEFLERRYSAGARNYLAGVSILAYILTKISVTIAAGGIVFETLLGLEFWTGAVIVVIATGVYTVMGGLRTVLYLDMLQMFVMIGGGFAVTLIGLQQVGGWTVLTETVGPEYLDLWRATSDPDFPWTGIIFGAPILAVWYWCTDQFIVQRTLSAKTIDEARRATIFAALLKQLPLFIFVMPGVIAFALAEQGRLTLTDPDGALPALIAAVLPIGLKGLVVAGLLAALMSSLSSVFNSCATLITMDVYKRIAPEASERRLVFVGQIATVLMVVFGLLWIPFMDAISGTLYVYLQSVQSYISPPIAAVFLVGVLWRGANAKGAVVALGAGLVLGVGRLVLEVQAGDLEGVLLTFATINFLHFAVLLFLVSVALLVVVSLWSEAPGHDVDALTLAGRGRASGGRDQPWVDVVVSVCVLLVVVYSWLSFA